MDRDGALDLLISLGFNGLMAQVGRDVTDVASGYGPALDRSFSMYITKFSLETGVTDTVVLPADVYGFTWLLQGTTYDLVLPSLARQPDTSVDAPLISVKLSQTFKATLALRDRAWAEIGAYGYIEITNMSGHKVNLDFNEKQWPIAYEY